MQTARATSQLFQGGDLLRPPLRLPPLLLVRRTPLIIRPPTRHLATNKPPSSKPISNPDSSASASASPLTPTSSRPLAPAKSLPQRIYTATESTFNFTLLLLGLALTSGVSYTLYTYLLSPLAPTRQFNAALKRIRHHRELSALLGGGTIRGFGEATTSRRAFARPFAYEEAVDWLGGDHLIIRFWVSGEGEDDGSGTKVGARRGRVTAHVYRARGDWWNWKYEELFVDVEGKQRVYLESRNTRPTSPPPEKPYHFLGIDWKR